MVLWEIFTYGKQPWFELSNSEVIKAVSEGHLLSQPDNCPDEVYQVMLNCWRAPNERLTMAQLHVTLANLLNESKRDDYLDLIEEQEKMNARADDHGDDTDDDEVRGAHGACAVNNNQTDSIKEINTVQDDVT